MRKPVGFETRVQRSMMHGLRACNQEGVYRTDVTRAMRNAGKEVSDEAKRRMIDQQLIMSRPVNNQLGRPALEIHTTRAGRERLAELEAVFGDSNKSVWG